MSDTRQTAAVDDFINNFPFPTLRERQSYVLNEISAAFASGYKYIVLEAPTGFGKSPVAIAVARTLGTSYICTSTKDLQTQYARDFPFLKIAKGKNNFICAVKEDFIKNGTFKCGLCNSNKAKECHHITADYGPCMSNESFRVKNKKSGCKYRTFRQHYKVKNKGTIEEQVLIDQHTTDYYQQEYPQWVHIKNLKKPRSEWTPCEYFDQLNVALTSSHSIFNYSNFLAFLILELQMPEVLPHRELLILDEAHRLEEEIVKFVGISISKRRWRRYIPNFGYNDVEKWINFLTDLEAKALNLTHDVSEELVVEAKTDAIKLIQAIDNICSNPKNWIVTEIKKENNEVTRVELKPLDVSPYCKDIFKKCSKVLMMSATILDKDAFCTSLGLAPGEAKFIQVPSDFPLQNRPIYPLNIAHLNSNSLKQQEIQIKVARAIDNLMHLHKNHKGIIHTTSYKQLDFIKENISETNRCRLLKTDPEIPREEVITEHMNNIKPTVLISPSLYIGLDLKDDLSRFQIITKVPYPDLGDRWINEKRKINAKWYTWQTALRLVQGYGRSIRSKEDYAVTYVLDSGFENFVKRNKNILPEWFTQAIHPGLLEAPLGRLISDSDNSKVLTQYKENHNPVTNNHYISSVNSEQTLKQNVNNTAAEKNEIASTSIRMSDPSQSLASLDIYIKDESKRQERLFICPYCVFRTPLENEYQRYIVVKHRGKSGYRNMAVTG